MSGLHPDDAGSNPAAKKKNNKPTLAHGFFEGKFHRGVFALFFMTFALPMRHGARWVIGRANVGQT